MNNDIIKQVEYRGFNINFYQDSNPMNPRTDYDQLATMVCFHRRYTLGDDHDFSDNIDKISLKINHYY